jgi:type I restriction enzyme S subunit
MSHRDEWDTVPLGELCRLVNGKAFRPSDWAESGLPIIRIQNLNDETKRFNYWAGSIERQVMVNSGDVLLGWSGTPGTSFGAHIWERQRGVLNQHIFRVDLDEARIVKEWAVPAINHQLGVLIGKAHGGVGLRHVKKGEVESLPIPLPPLVEQKRIAGILKDQLAAVECARAAAQAQLQAAKALPSAYLKDILSTGQAAGWPIKRLGSLLTAIEAGKCVSCEERPAKSTEWGVLKVSAVTWGAFRPEENKVLPAEFDVPSDREVREGDVLISRSNTTELVGAVVHVKKTRPRLMLSDKTLRLVSRDTEIMPDFLELALRSPQCRSFIEENATGASSSMKNITQDTIRDIPLPVPPISEQRSIMARVSTQLAAAEPMRTAIGEQLGAITQMPAAVLRAAFEGAL